jgi:hypothetical protein
MSKHTDKIAQIAKRTGYSPAEVEECLTENLDRILRRFQKYCSRYRS